jgi:hypothetical protein
MNQTKTSVAPKIKLSERVPQPVTMCTRILK